MKELKLIIFVILINKYGVLKKEFKEKDFQTGSKIKTQLLVENKRICQSFLGKLKGMNKDILGEVKKMKEISWVHAINIRKR